MLLSLFFLACSEKKEKDTVSAYDPETIPTMKTHNDTMYISDSGRVKYKVIAQTMLVFDKAKEPYMLFPDSAYLEQYDSLMNVVTTMRADSIWNYSKKSLWKLRGDVKIRNIKGETFDSEELFWDEKTHKMYSNKYVIIHQPMRQTIRAYSFEANEDVSAYTFKRAENVDLYVNEEEEDTTIIENTGEEE